MILPKTINALILAGRRRIDPLSKAERVENKALIELHGRKLFDWVAEALTESPSISRLWASIEPSQMHLFDAELKRFKIQPISTASDRSPVQACIDLMQNIGPDELLLVTTADNPLLTNYIVEDFLRKCIEQKQVEIGIGIVNAYEGFLDAYPEMRTKRTWHKLNRQMWLSGTNLFFWSPQGFTARSSLLAKDFENNRKSPAKLARLVGRIDPLFWCRLLLGIVDIPQCDEALSQFFGVKAGLIEIGHPEACIDVDKPEDLRLVNKILASRLIMNSQAE